MQHITIQNPELGISISTFAQSWHVPMLTKQGQYEIFRVQHNQIMLFLHLQIHWNKHVHTT